MAVNDVFGFGGLDRSFCNDEEAIQIAKDNGWNFEKHTLSYVFSLPGDTAQVKFGDHYTKKELKKMAKAYKERWIQDRFA